MPYSVDVSAASAKAASKLRDTLKTGKLDSLADAVRKETAGLTTADGTALPAARGFSLGAVDGVPSTRSLDLAPLSAAAGTAKAGLSKGALIGIIVGSILGALLLAGLVWLLCCRKPRGGASAAAAPAAVAAPAKAPFSKMMATTAAPAAAASTVPDPKLAGAGARSGKEAAAAVEDAPAPAKPSGLAKLASSLSGRLTGSTKAEAGDVVDTATDAANRV
jgi:hypothetical protein